MGLHASGDKLLMASRYQLWQFDNLLESGESYGAAGAAGAADRLYVPRTGQTTGDVNAHEVAIDGSGQAIFVNTDFSCLATLSPDYSFVPLWQPPFISKLAAEDRCHLNGMAMVEGKPAYVTACSATDSPAGWRNCRREGGVVIDVERNEIIATGLSMPHSPRWYRGKLWLLNAGTGELGYIDQEREGQEAFVPVCFCPGFVRGLDFVGDFAVVGLSKLRSPQFSGLALEERLAAEGNQSHCGILVIDLNSGRVVHWLHLGGTIEELFDVVVLPGVRQPQALGFQGDDLQRLVRFPGAEGVIVTKPSPALAGEAHSTTEPASIALGPVKYQKVYHLNPGSALPYEALTYPSLQQRWQTQPPQGELFGISASVEGSMVGFAVAERVSAEVAQVISLFVLPTHRRQGIGTRLLGHLEKALAQQNCQQLRFSYAVSELTPVALEPLLQRLQWPAPEPTTADEAALQTAKQLVTAS